MEHSELTSRVLKVLRETGGERFGMVAPDSNLAALGMDSLDMAMMAMTIEREFHVAIETEELPNIRTVQDVIDGLEKKLGQPV